jgi:hypothetical protein
MQYKKTSIANVKSIFINIIFCIIFFHKFFYVYLQQMLEVNEVKAFGFGWVQEWMD